MNAQQRALIKKDIRSITSNKQVLMVILMVPLTLSIVLPSIILFVTVLVPESTSDFQKLLNMLSVPVGEHNQEQIILGLVLNKIIPAFFLIFPAVLALVMTVILLPMFELGKWSVARILFLPLTGSLQGIVTSLLIVTLSFYRL